MGIDAKKVGAASLALIAGIGIAPLAQSAPEAFADTDSAGQTVGATLDDTVVDMQVKPSIVQGVFSYTQSAVDSTSGIARWIYEASDVLCGAGADMPAVTGETAGEWVISVSGDVEHAYVATMDDLVENGSVRKIIGCSCAGNPIGGLASVNADVTGVTLSSILDAAGVKDGANSIAFISPDGFEVKLPLFYVQQRYSMIVSEINGEPLCDVGGCANQLWLGSTSARYFAQNVSSIVVSTESEADIPPIPGTPEAGDRYDNVPNVSLK